MSSVNQSDLLNNLKTKELPDSNLHGQTFELILEG